MLFTKTICKPGAYVAIVPVGLQATLQYNKDGLLESISNGYDDIHKTYFSKAAFDDVIKRNLVPIKVPIKGGTTWVQGVFYSANNLTQASSESIMQNSDYTFYAGRVTSLAASFKSVLSIRNWLTMSKFNLLPGMLVKVGMNETEFIDAVNRFNKFPFIVPLFAGYMIFENTSYRYHDTKLTQITVKNISNEYDPNGYLKSKISWEDERCVGENLVDYSVTANFSIQEKDVLIRDDDHRIIYNVNQGVRPIQKKVACIDCGNLFTLPSKGPVSCTDPHCISKLYSEICHFTSTLALPDMTFDRFKELKLQKKLMCLTDIFCLPEYEASNIDIAMDVLLSAVVPLEVCRDASIFNMIWNKSDRSLQTFNYYIHNPDRIAIDLNLNTSSMKSVIEWLKDPYNLSTIISLLDMKQINIIKSTKKFDGPLIFRNKVIAITGIFKHGDISEVSSILESYGAKVITMMQDKVDCVIVGDTKENISGSVILSAKSLNIPIFNESQFFKEYKIDEDLAENLL